MVDDNPEKEEAKEKQTNNNSKTIQQNSLQLQVTHTSGAMDLSIHN